MGRKPPCQECRQSDLLQRDYATRNLGGDRDETVEPQAKSQKPVLVCYLVDNGHCANRLHQHVMFIGNRNGLFLL